MPYYDSAAQPTQPRTLLGHPPGLFILFFTEMWERFSYYGMRSLLVLFMVDHLFLRPDVGQEVLGFNAIKGTLESIFGPLAAQPLSSQIYGLYTAFVYLTPLFGGILADRWLGRRKTVVLGAALMAIGHFLMAVENLFFIALLFLIMGNGAFKPNISTQVGDLYPPGDPRRDRAFTIFYMGINLGAFFSPLICGTLGQRLGWHYGFGAAGVGMVLGLILYLWGRKFLAPEVIARTKEERKQERRPLSKDEWRRVWALVVLCGLNIVFWGVYEQQGNTMQLWADRNTNWNFFGFEVPSTWYQAFNPMIIFIFAPLLNMFWAWQAGRKREPAQRDQDGDRLLPARRVLPHHDRRLARHGPRGAAQRALAAQHHLHPHDRGAVPVADRALAGDQGGARAHRLDDDGRLVPLQLLRQLPVGLPGHLLGADAARGLLRHALRAGHRGRDGDLDPEQAAEGGGGLARVARRRRDGGRPVGRARRPSGAGSGRSSAAWPG